MTLDDSDSRRSAALLRLALRGGGLAAMVLERAGRQYGSTTRIIAQLGEPLRGYEDPAPDLVARAGEIGYTARCMMRLGLTLDECAIARATSAWSQREAAARLGLSVYQLRRGITRINARLRQTSQGASSAAWHGLAARHGKRGT